MLADISLPVDFRSGTAQDNTNYSEIQLDTSIYQDGEGQYTMLRYGAMATKWEEPPGDPLNALILNAVDIDSLDSVTQNGYVPFDLKRTEGTVKDPFQ